jgi:hypothetical protein
MGSAENFLSRFGGGAEAVPETNLLSAGAPNALASFMDTFTTSMEILWFYNHTEEVRYNKEDHVYFRVDPDLGNLIELYGVTNVLKKAIDRSVMLVPWAAKMAIEKLLRTIPVVQDTSGVSWIAPMTLTDFTKLALEAKGAHKEKLEEAGDIGHIAHLCLSDSIQHAIDHTNSTVLELRNIPTDEKAKACAEAGLAWMRLHNVRWIKTEQKIYSREYGYAGTMDGLATVDSCGDPSCCTEQFKDRLSLIDFKSSNALHIEYLFQTASYQHAEQEEQGLDIKDRWILRLGKNEEEAGKFEPWHCTAKDFKEDFEGFLTCLALNKLLDSVKERMSLQKKGVREAKKQLKAIQKEIDKAAAKVKKEADKAQLKLDRAAEKERIKADAKKAREEAKLAKTQDAKENTLVPEDEVKHAEVERVKESVLPIVSENAEPTDVCVHTVERPKHAEAPAIPLVVADPVSSSRPIEEEAPIERKPFVVPMEG